MTDESTEVTPPIKSVDNRQPNGKFGPGNIANPHGRPPKGHTLTDLMRQILDEDPERKRKLMITLLDMAAKKDIAAIREVLDRLEGKPLMSVEHREMSGEPDNVIIDTEEKKKPVDER